MKNIKDFENKIIQGDALEVLKTFPDDCIDTITTSPPYWGLRDYGVKGQIGLEKTLEEYLKKLLDITAELKRVLKPTGVMFWNHGDCYGGIKTGKTDKKVADYVKESQKNLKKYAPYYEKCLMFQNYRLILKMIDEQGWILRNTIIWNKPNHMPSSVKDRFTNAYEPVFMLVKNKKYWFDLDVVRVPATTKPWGKQTRLKGNYKWMKTDYTTYQKTKIPKEQAESFGSPRSRNWRKEEKEGIKIMGFKDPHRSALIGGLASGEAQNNPRGKNPGDVWKIATQPFSEAHFATFPEKLIEPMILSSCPQWICKKCGKIRVRIVKHDSKAGFTEKEYKEWEKKTGIVGKDRGNRATLGLKKKGSVKYEGKTIGWTDCKCGKGFEPGIVLDPFMGAGTVGVVAKKLNRKYIGIELNPEYIKIAENRIKLVRDQLPL